jgi:phosphohistidine phosphatase
MRAILVHHSEALDPDVDPLRPLTTHGHDQAGWLAEQVRAAGLKPAAIWHSGKLRSRQTAEPFYRVCNPFADFKMVRGLNPGDRPRTIADALVAETGDVLLIGHRPHIGLLLEALSPESRSFPLHGVVILEFEKTTAAWREIWRCQPPERA